MLRGPMIVTTALRSVRLASTVPSSNMPVQIPKGQMVKEDSEMLQPIDIENLPRAQKRFAKQFEQLNYQRIQEIFRKNRKVTYWFEEFEVFLKPEKNFVEKAFESSKWNFDLLLFRISPDLLYS